MLYLLQHPADADMSALIKLHNAARQPRLWGPALQPLVAHAQLMAYAQHHADWMAKSQQIRHSKLQDIMNLGFGAAGENIAVGSKTPKEVLNQWLWSLAHRRNILNANFNAIGCGAKKAESGKLYWCVCFGAAKQG